MRPRLLACLFFLCCSALAHADFDEGMKAYEMGDYTTAHGEFLQAAQQGDIRAQGKLGGLYLYGAGVEKDAIQAYAWFDLAARQGDTAAAQFRDAIEARFTVEELRSAMVLAEDYYDRYLAPFTQ